MKVKISTHWQQQLGATEIDFSDLKEGRVYENLIDQENMICDLKCDECCDVPGCIPHEYMTEECPHCMGSKYNRNSFNDLGELIKIKL